MSLAMALGARLRRGLFARVTQDDDDDALSGRLGHVDDREGSRRIDARARGRAWQWAFGAPDGAPRDGVTRVGWLARLVGLFAWIAIIGAFWGDFPERAGSLGPDAILLRALHPTATPPSFAAPMTPTFVALSGAASSAPTAPSEWPPVIRHELGQHPEWLGGTTLVGFRKGNVWAALFLAIAMAELLLACGRGRVVAWTAGALMLLHPLTFHAVMLPLARGMLVATAATVLVWAIQIAAWRTRGRWRFGAVLLAGVAWLHDPQIAFAGALGMIVFALTIGRRTVGYRALLAAIGTWTTPLALLLAAEALGARWAAVTPFPPTVLDALPGLEAYARALWDGLIALTAPLNADAPHVAHAPDATWITVAVLGAMTILLFSARRRRDALRPWLDEVRSADTVILFVAVAWTYVAPSPLVPLLGLVALISLWSRLLAGGCLPALAGGAFAAWCAITFTASTAHEMLNLRDAAELTQRVQTSLQHTLAKGPTPTRVILLGTPQQLGTWPVWPDGTLGLVLADAIPQSAWTLVSGDSAYESSDELGVQWRWANLTTLEVALTHPPLDPPPFPEPSTYTSLAEPTAPTAFSREDDAVTVTRVPAVRRADGTVRAGYRIAFARPLDADTWLLAWRDGHWMRIPTGA